MASEAHHDQARAVDAPGWVAPSLRAWTQRNARVARIMIATFVFARPVTPAPGKARRRTESVGTRSA
jgi:hypothetical protein